MIEGRKDEKKGKGRREGGREEGRAGMKEVLRKLRIRNILMSSVHECVNLPFQPHLKLY